MSVGDEIRALLAQRKAKGFDPRLARVKGTYRFEIDGVGVLRVVVDHGNINVVEGGGEADCIVTVHDPEDFLRVARGEQNLITAFMQGRVDMEGDFALAQLLHSITPGKTEREPEHEKGVSP